MADSATIKTPKQSQAHSFYVFSLLFLLYMFDYIDRMIVSSLFPFLQADWGLSDAQCGLLISSVYWSIIVFTLPVSLLIDRWSRKKSIGAMALLWSLATGACAFTRSFSQLFTARVAIGIGEAGYAPGGTAMISALFPQRRRAMIMGIWNASIPLGSAIGIVLGGIVAEHWGWRHAFGLVAIPGMIVAILFFRVRDYKTVELSSGAKGSERTWGAKLRVVKKLVTTPSLLLTFFAFSGNTFVTTAMLSWLPTYFHRNESIPISDASMKSGSIMLLAVIGAPLGGFLADRWYAKNLKARLLFPAISSAITAIFLGLSFSVFEGKAQYVTLLLSGVSIAAFVPAAAAVTQDVVHPGVRALSYSLCVIVQNLLGSSLGPVVIGAVSDRFGIGIALSMLPLFSLLAAVLFTAASFFYVSDLNKVENVIIEFEN